MVSDTHEKFFTLLDLFYVPRFSDLERDYVRQENVENEQLTAFVATTRKLFACEREPGCTVGSTVPGKKSDLSDTKKVVTRLPRVTCGYQRRGCLARNN